MPKLSLPPFSKFTLILISLIILLASGGFFAYQKLTAKQASQPVEEVDLAFDPEGPYAVLTPRRDGNALILNIKRTASYDAISYELAYNAEGIDRGVMGEINTKEKKGEYEQEILFGTCSKNVCKYDKDVSNGTLTLHIRKGSTAYRMVTQWHLQKPDLALGILTSGDNHFTFKIEPDKNDLSLIKYTIINDLSGAPRLPIDKTIIGKVYAISSPNGKTLSSGTISLELAENPSEKAVLAHFNELADKWDELSTKISGSTLSASTPEGGIFAILTPKN